MHSLYRRTRSAFFVLIPLVLAGHGVARAVPSPRATVIAPEVMRLSNAAPSVEVLMGRLLDALARQDLDALHKLRVTETEYRLFFLPGSVKQGEPLQIFPDRESRFFWELMNTKSLYAGQGLLRTFGGHRYTLKDVTYRKGHRTYAWFEAYGDPIVLTEDAEGREVEIEIGSVVVVNGQYKFMAFNSD
jgi:hypothetical protein